MLGNFTYYNPAALHFGEGALNALKGELEKYGRKVLLTYGGGSIKKTGIYDDVLRVLSEAGADVTELPGVMPNPTLEKLYEGAKLAREKEIDLILGVGGGSVVDYCKAVAASAYCDEDPWQKYFIRMEEPDCKVIPVGCVLTMVGTGSEMNGGSVITNNAENMKIGKVFGPELYPKFSILNPRYTMSVPHYQMVAGFFDIMSHILEQYLSGDDDNVSDYLAEALMRSLVHSSRIAVKNPHDYEARSNIMWIATWALNTLIGKGKSGDWEVHMIGQAIGAHTDAAHGMTLSAVSLPYYRFIKKDGLARFVRFAKEVWGVCPDGKTDEEIADEGLAAFEAWMGEIGVVRHSRELGVGEEMIEAIADSTLLLEDGYRHLTREEVVDILRASL